MAPLSILPGRVRFEDLRLIGNETLSRYLETAARRMTGVSQVSASHRTGRILVEFSEDRISRDDLANGIRELLLIDPPLTEAAESSATAAAMPDSPPLLSSRQILTDMALHLLLPAPFDLLLPAVGSAFRRNQTAAATA